MTEEEFKPFVCMEEINSLFAAKLLETNSMQKAFLKVAWVIFNIGIKIGREEAKSKLNQEISK